MSAVTSARVVATGVDVAVVEAHAVGAGDEVGRARDEVVDDHDGVPCAPIGEP